MMSCSEAGIWWFRKKDVSWDLTLGEARPPECYGMRGAFVGSVSWGFDSGPGSPAGVGCGRCRNSHHSNKCVSLSSCRKTKLKKLIKVSYMNYGVSSVFRYFNASGYITDCSTLPLIRIFWCWVLSKEVSRTIFKSLVWRDLGLSLGLPTIGEHSTH